MQDKKDYPTEEQIATLNALSLDDLKREIVRQLQEMENAQAQGNRLFDIGKRATYVYNVAKQRLREVEAETKQLSDAGEEVEYLTECVSNLEKQLAALDSTQDATTSGTTTGTQSQIALDQQLAQSLHISQKDSTDKDVVLGDATQSTKSKFGPPTTFGDLPQFVKAQLVKYFGGGGDFLTRHSQCSWKVMQTASSFTKTGWASHYKGEIWTAFNLVLDQAMAQIPRFRDIKLSPRDREAILDEFLSEYFVDGALVGGDTDADLPLLEQDHARILAEATMPSSRGTFQQYIWALIVLNLGDRDRQNTKCTWKEGIRKNGPVWIGCFNPITIQKIDDANLYHRLKLQAGLDPTFRAETFPSKRVVRDTGIKWCLQKYTEGKSAGRTLIAGTGGYATLLEQHRNMIMSSSKFMKK